MRAALVLSVVVHAAALFGARPIASRLSDLASLAAPEPLLLEPDRLSGTSIEVAIGGEDLSGSSPPPPSAVSAAAGDVTTPAPAPSETAPPSPSTAPSAAPSSAPSAAPSAPSAHASSEPAPSAAPRPTSKPKAARPPRKKRRPSSPNATPTASASASASASAASSASPSASEPASPAASASASSSGTGTGTGTGSGGSFGPDGAASRRDLGKAFTRAIPYASAGDALWTKVAVGNAGTLRAAIHVDAEGHVTGAEPLGEDPPAHLVSLLRRTVGELKAGIFAVQNGAVSAGTQTVEIKAVVSSEAGDDALAFEYESGRGKAAFIAKGGRRVDVQVRVVSVKLGD